MTPPDGSPRWLTAFLLVYLTLFLDNVLLTVLVPIIPDWVREPSRSSWGAEDGPANATRRDDDGGGGAQALVGAVLSAKALAQLLTAGPAAAAVSARGPAAVLRAGTALLLLAALVFAASGARGGAWGALAGRAAQGAGAALSGVAGLALAQRVVPRRHSQRALAALLGAVALGVLVGYPFGGATYALWSPAVPFLIIAAVVLAALAMQHRFLSAAEFNEATAASGGAGWRGVAASARRPPCAAAAGAVLLATAAMAALEPCLPPWLMARFHPRRWVAGAVFVPDSAAYLAGGALAGGAARRLGAERLALAGLAGVAAGALALPLARSPAALAAPHAALGAGLGVLDGALVPALLAAGGGAQRAAVLHAAGSAAYALGPTAGGLLAWALGFETLMRALGVANLLYAAFLYRHLRDHPLSPQWGATTDDEEDMEPGDLGESAPLRTSNAPPE